MLIIKDKIFWGGVILIAASILTPIILIMLGVGD
jgi:hypothetical protein